MKIRLLVLIILVLGFTSCARKEAKPNFFIKDVSLLKAVKDQEGKFYYLNEKINLKKYNKIIVSNIKILAHEDIDKDLIKESSIYFRNSLDKELNKVFKNNISNNSLTLKISIISFESSFDDLKFYQLLPYSLAFKAISRGVGFEKRKIRVLLALN